ncbi:MAG TPA: nitroreductase family protein, partial [Acidimicrobiia bacterium]|nr:nitroreductase family protein [Acidimicrobiia bacterium]
EHLTRILEAGRRTPSSSNRQRWDFVLVQDRERLGRLSQVWRGAGHVAKAAAAIGIVAPVTDDWDTHGSIEYDLGQATMSMMLAAADLGIGTGHAAVLEQEMAREILGLPQDRELAWMLALGYPADRPLRPIKNPSRRPFEEVVHHEVW